MFGTKSSDSHTFPLLKSAELLPATSHQTGLLYTHFQFLAPITPCAAFSPRDILVSCSYLFMCVSPLDYELLKVKVIGSFTSVPSLSAEQSTWPGTEEMLKMSWLFTCAAKAMSPCTCSGENVEALFLKIHTRTSSKGLISSLSNGVLKLVQQRRM